MPPTIHEVVKSPFSSCLKIERAKRRLDPHYIFPVKSQQIASLTDIARAGKVFINHGFKISSQSMAHPNVERYNLI